MILRLTHLILSTIFLRLLSVGLVLIGIAYPHCAKPQQSNEDKRLSQYVLRGWNTEDGLTSESVNEMAQTLDGYLWIGTYTGLHRFDGKDFTVYTSQNSDLPSSNVLRIEKGRGNEIWVGTLHGIAIFDDGKFIVPPGLESVKHLGIEEMHIAQNGDLWFSSKSNNLFRYSDGKLEELTKEFEV